MELENPALQILLTTYNDLITKPRLKAQSWITYLTDSSMLLLIYWCLVWLFHLWLPVSFVWLTFNIVSDRFFNISCFLPQITEQDVRNHDLVLQNNPVTLVWDTRRLDKSAIQAGALIILWIVLILHKGKNKCSMIIPFTVILTEQAEASMKLKLASRENYMSHVTT